MEPVYCEAATVEASSEVTPKLDCPALCCAVSEIGNVAAVGGRDGRSFTLAAAAGHSMVYHRSFRQPHVGDVNVMRVFPSGRVLLTGSADATLAIWDLPSGRRAVTLGKGGHSRGVLSAAVVDRGREVLSSSRDGTVLRWECATQSVVSVLHKASVSAVGDVVPVNSVWSVDSSVALAALDDGSVVAVDSRSGGEVAYASLGGSSWGAANSCCANAFGTVFFAGFEDGTVAAWDSRMPAAPVRQPFRRSAGAVSDMHAGKDASRVWISTRDGLLWQHDFEKGCVAADLVGHEYEPVTSFCPFHGGNSVMSTARDGRIRIFSLDKQSDPHEPFAAPPPSAAIADAPHSAAASDSPPAAAYSAPRSQQRKEKPKRDIVRKGDEGSWDHAKWLRQFRQASSARDSGTLRQLRVDVFHETRKAFERGGYVQTLDNPATRVYLPEDARPQARLERLTTMHDFGGRDRRIVDDHNRRFATDRETEVRVLNADCIETALSMQVEGLSPALLNMASARHPGGGYLSGAGAQEENIFRRTNCWLFLHPDVRPGAEQPPFRYPLPHEGGLYSPKVTVIRGSEAAGYPFLVEPAHVDIVSVAAVSHPELVRENGELLLDAREAEVTLAKIRAIFKICLEHGNDSMVLSAFGCGAFQNPPLHVARLFKQAIEEFKGCFKVITFAIIDDHNARREHNPDGNFAPFLHVFPS